MINQTRRRVRMLVLSGLAVSAVALGGAQPASAGVGDYFYDGRSAAATGCNNDARTVATKRVGGGATILLRYSPSCRTVWAHIKGAARRTPDQAGGSARIVREQDGATLRCRTNKRRSCTTRMLYDGGFTAHAVGTNDTGFQIYEARTRSF